MEVFRISRSRYIDDLTGTGSRMAGGRWNSKGTAVVYTSGYRSLAALELLVHVPQKNLTQDFVIATIHIPDHIYIKNLTKEILPKDWRSITINPGLQIMGDAWIKEGKFCLLRVPSVVIPEEWNYLINPLHSDSKHIKISKKYPFVLDKRLMIESS